MNKNIRDLALEIATKAHEGQFREDKVTPYISHPIEVARIALEMLYQNYPPLSFSIETENRIYIAALGHDILEDSDLTDSDLRNFGIQGLDQLALEMVWVPAIESILFLSRKEKQTYLDYLLKIKNNFVAKIVKLADLQHNLSDSKPGTNRTDKYLLAQYILQN